MKETRFVELRNVTMPVRVSHGQLSPEQRIDELPNRIDTLDLSLLVAYQADLPIKPQSMQGVWSYGDIYQLLCMSDVQTITGPLEGILDNALQAVEDSAASQLVSLDDVEITANRMGLAVGYPRLVARKRYVQSPGNASEFSRTAGICEFPLVISVNHAWCEGAQRVEHVDVRTEAVQLSFSAETRAQSLASGDLRGLYNYAGLIHKVQRMHGVQISGPVEELCDMVSDVLLHDAQALGVSLLQTTVEVKRTGYARCTPVLKLVRDFRD